MRVSAFSPIARVRTVGFLTVLATAKTGPWKTCPNTCLIYRDWAMYRDARDKAIKQIGQRLANLEKIAMDNLAALTSKTGFESLRERQLTITVILCN